MKLNLKEIVENLIDNFLEAGDLAIQLREKGLVKKIKADNTPCLLYTSPSPRDATLSRMPSSA